MITLKHNAPIDGREIERIHFYDASGIVFTINRRFPEVGDGYRNKLDEWRIPTPQTDVRNARKVEFNKGDVFAIKTKGASYSFERAKCELYVPVACMGGVEVFDRISQHSDGKRRDYMPTARVTLFGQLEPQRYFPEEVRAEIEAECGPAETWDRITSDHAWRKVENEHPSRGWKPGKVYEGERVELACGTYSRTERSPREAKIEELAELVGAKGYEGEKVIRALLDNPEALKLLKAAMKASNFDPLPEA